MNASSKKYRNETKPTPDGKAWSVDALETLKLDGVANIVRAPNTLVELVWSAVLLTSGSLCLWLLVQTCHEFSQNEVSTLTRMVNTNKAVVFPTVSMCNMNPFTSQLAMRLLDEANVTLDMSNPQRDDVFYFFDFVQIQRHIQATRDRFMQADEMRALNELDTMLVSCEFAGKPCNVSDFEYFYHPYFYVCYRFNARGQLSVGGPGENYQLRVELYAGVPDRLEDAPLRGFWLYIQNR